MPKKDNKIKKLLTRIASRKENKTIKKATRAVVDEYGDVLMRLKDV